MKFFATLSIILALTYPALAAPSEILRCSTIGDSIKRLACFDDIAASEKNVANPTAESATAPNAPGKWVIKVDQPRGNARPSASISVRAKDAVRGKLGKLSTPTLIIGCRAGVTSASIDFDGLFMSDTGSYGDVTLSVDKQKAFMRSMDASTDRQALGFWRSEMAIPLINTMLQGESLLVRALPFSEAEITMTFEIAGLETAIVPVRTACNWG